MRSLPAELFALYKFKCSLIFIRSLELQAKTESDGIPPHLVNFELKINTSRVSR